MKIYAPVKDFNGWRNTVRFVNGVGETNDPKVAEWFATHGYKVPVEESPRVEELLTQIVENSEPISQPDFDSMNPVELREWAIQNGYGSKIKNIRNKEKLLNIIRG